MKLQSSDAIGYAIGKDYAVLACMQREKHMG